MSDVKCVIAGSTVNFVCDGPCSSSGFGSVESVVASGANEGSTSVRTSSERNSQLLCNLFVSQRLTRVLKPPKRPLPTTFLPQKAYFQPDQIFPLSFQRLSRVTYLYRPNLQPIRRTNYLPTEAI